MGKKRQNAGRNPIARRHPWSYAHAAGLHPQYTVRCADIQFNETHSSFSRLPYVNHSASVDSHGSTGKLNRRGREVQQIR
jgi:hypothetical protein